jgi:hypothetical protein
VALGGFDPESKEPKPNMGNGELWSSCLTPSHDEEQHGVDHQLEEADVEIVAIAIATKRG